MAGQWLRMIDSAQRQIVLEQPVSPSFGPMDRLTFEIQGLLAETMRGRERFPFADMVEYGVTHRGVKPHSLWARLMRRPAPLGEVRLLDTDHLVAAFWTQPVLDLVFPLDKEGLALWRECEIMVLSGGFHFQVAGEARRFTQGRGSKMR